MGRERSRARQYLYFCTAVLIITLFAACAPLGIKLAEKEDPQLQLALQLFARDDFDGALRENSEVLARFPRTPPGDAALFNMGLIYIDHANPKRDIGLALQSFVRLEVEFPESPRAKEARIWAGILHSLERTMVRNIEIKEKARDIQSAHEKVRLQRMQQELQPTEEEVNLQRMRRLLDQEDFAGALLENRELLDRFPKTTPGDEALFNMGLIHVHYANPKKNIGQALHFFNRLEKEFPDSARAEEARIWVGILETMEKTRKIDLEIEERKRELRR